MITVSAFANVLKTLHGSRIFGYDFVLNKPHLKSKLFVCESVFRLVIYQCIRCNPDLETSLNEFVPNTRAIRSLMYSFIHINKPLMLRVGQRIT